MSSTLVNLPFASRHWMMRSAIAGPMRGRVSSCAASAVFRLTRPSPARRGAPTAGAAPTARHEKLLAVAEWSCEVHRRLIGSGREAAGRRDGIDNPRTLAEHVQARGDHRAGDVDEDRCRGCGIRPAGVIDRDRLDRR